MLLAFLSMICFRGKIVHNPLIKVGPWAAGREIKNYRTLRNPDYGQIRRINSGTNKVRNSGLGPDPDLSAKNGPEKVWNWPLGPIFFGIFCRV